MDLRAVTRVNGGMHGWMGDARETTGVDVAPVTPLARLGPARGMARMVSLPRFFVYLFYWIMVLFV